MLYVIKVLIVSFNMLGKSFINIEISTLFLSGIFLACMKCILCGSSDQRAYHRIEEDKYIKESVKYVKCKKCGLVFISPPPVKKLRELYRLEYRAKIGFFQTLKYLIPISPQSVHLKYLKQRGILKKEEVP